VIAESGVSKASLYRTFHTKDALVEAFVAERDRLYWTWWDKIAERHGDDPCAQLDAVLVGVAKQIGRSDYRGCPFLNTATEFPDDAHPGRAVAQANKDELRTRLTELCARIGVANPAEGGTQLFLLINGAYTAGRLAGAADLRTLLVDAAHRLIDSPG